MVTLISYQNYLTPELLRIADNSDNCLAVELANRLRDCIEELHEVKTEVAFEEVSSRLQTIEAQIKERHKGFDYLDYLFLDLDSQIEQEILVDMLPVHFKGITPDEIDEVIDEIVKGCVPYQLRAEGIMTRKQKYSITVATASIGYVEEEIEKSADMVKTIKENDLDLNAISKTLDISQVYVRESAVYLHMDYSDTTAVMSVLISDIENVLKNIRRGEAE